MIDDQSEAGSWAEAIAHKSEIDRLNAALEKRVTAKAYIERAAQLFEVPVSEMLSGSRQAQYVKPRNAVAYVLRSKRPDMSLPQIARHLGRKDHSTIIHALFRAEQMLARDQDFDTNVKILEAM